MVAGAIAAGRCHPAEVWCSAAKRDSECILFRDNEYIELSLHYLSIDLFRRSGAASVVVRGKLYMFGVSYHH